MTTEASNILLVDDDLAMRRLLGTYLELAGYSVRTAADGREALAAIEHDCPDIVLTDWDMPGMNGLELCRQIRSQQLPHYVYILFLTVKATHHEMVQGLHAGADDFVTKPVQKDELLARLHAGTRVLELERRLSHMARTDSLTGLYTQRVFYELLDKEWNRAARYELPLSCVMVDLDFFKRVNDVYGHPAGDAVLKRIAGVLAGECRASDTICRYGGEEFCLLLPETPESGAVEWAERMRKRIGAEIVSWEGEDIRVTASFGVAQRYDDTQTAAQLVDLADQALLCAKRAGRDRVVDYQSLNAARHLSLDGSGPTDLFHGARARDVMTPVVACLREHETVGRAAEFFLQSRINSTPVVDAEGRLVGMISDKDLMAALVSLDCWARPVRELMKPNVIAYDQATPIHVIYEFLCRVSIFRVVITAGDRPTGTISRGSLLRWFRNLVLAKGLVGHEAEAAQVASPDAERTRQRLAETVRELGHQSSLLEGHLQKDDDLVPLIVGAATGMQDLVNDLLAHARFAQPTAGTAAAFQQSMMLEGGGVE